MSENQNFRVDNQPEVSVDMSPPRQKEPFMHITKAMAFGVGFAVMLVLAGFMYLLKQNAQLKSQLTAVSPEDELVVVDDSMIDEVVASSDLVVFARDNDLYALSEGEVKPLTQSGNSVTAFDFDQTSKKVVYTQGEMKPNAQGYRMLFPNTVVLYDYTSGESSDIFSFPYTEYPNQEYSLKLKDVAFSEDGMKIAITVSDGLLVYDLNTKQMSEIFRLPRDMSQRGGAGIFNYSHPQFSPDNQKLLLTRSYYESQDDIVVDLSSRTIKELPLTYPHTDDEADELLGWYDAQTLLIDRFNKELNAKQLFKLNVSDGSRTPFPDFDISELYVGVSQNQYLFRITLPGFPANQQPGQLLYTHLPTGTSDTVELQDFDNETIVGLWVEGNTVLVQRSPMKAGVQVSLDIVTFSDEGFGDYRHLPGAEMETY